MKKLLIATTNPGKLVEISTFLKDSPFELVSLKDVGIKDDVEETGKTYEENSLLKAIYYAKKSGLASISDDGGLEINALSGAPGVKSRRWIGENATEEDLIEHMKKVALELPDNNRTAYFRTVVTFALPSGKYFQVKANVKGEIAKKPLLKILKGYPYRSFFFLPGIKKFYHESELSKEEEKIYNHRYKAIVTKLLPKIKKYA
jgi:XTP/dITP diphosphohydrolase